MRGCRTVDGDGYPLFILIKIHFGNISGKIGQFGGENQLIESVLILLSDKMSICELVDNFFPSTEIGSKKDGHPF